ncbi:hypothetical protein [Streptomyces harbinensis]|uniref:hypothetical protein n=1 Tax=Streptomyces harbinensis TaxID=1176198 RepID=UPI001FEB9286|nr:hypothetical protein [Streptomyces harbinensis]
MRGLRRRLPGRLRGQRRRNIADAARDAGVERIVYNTNTPLPDAVPGFAGCGATGSGRSCACDGATGCGCGEEGRGALRNWPRGSIRGSGFFAAAPDGPPVPSSAPAPAGAGSGSGCAAGAAAPGAGAPGGGAGIASPSLGSGRLVPGIQVAPFQYRM